MIRRLTCVAAVHVANIPWVLVWIRAAEGTRESFDPIVAMLILLLIGVTVSIVVPCLLFKDLLVRRWFLITLLVFVNVFWPLRWIQLWLNLGDMPVSGPTQRVFLSEMVVSSVVAVALYLGTGAVLGHMRRRRAGSE